MIDKESTTAIVGDTPIVVKIWRRFRFIVSRCVRVVGSGQGLVVLVRFIEMLCLRFVEAAIRKGGAGKIKDTHRLGAQTSSERHND
jgi:hypothetical protein